MDDRRCLGASDYQTFFTDVASAIHSVAVP
jgi:hypothetical protein